MIRTNWKDRWDRRRYDCAPIAAIALFFICFFPHVLLGHSFIIAGDSYVQNHPLRTVAWAMIRSGHLPVWTSAMLAGYPLLSMTQVAIGYPVTWAYLFLSGLWAEQLYVLAPYLLSPIFTYAYVRELGRSRLAALLAGLAFSYGGMMCGFISNSGILTNTLMWTPLVLLYIDRSQKQPLINCLAPAALFYALSVLAGHPQSYVYAGTVIVAYGLFLSLFPTSHQSALNTWQRWRPLLVATAAMILAAGVAAFQLFESFRAAKRSIRSELTYERFSEGSFSLREAVLSLGAPLYHYVDTSPFVTPLALILAVGAIVLYSRRQDRADIRVWFWALVAVVSFVLLLGANTPLNRIVFHIPALKQFRVPSRHTFEFTFSISILAAFGWDWIIDAARTRLNQPSRKRNLLVAIVLLVASFVMGVLLWKATSKPHVPHPTIYTGLSENTYWIWKLNFTLVTLLLVAWCSRMLDSSAARTVLLGAAILISCFGEPSATVSRWWNGVLSLPASRLQLVSGSTRFLQQFPADQNRVYTRTQLFSEEFVTPPRLETPNLHALHGLQNVGGYEPLILERFSRALGGVGPDAVTPLPGYPPNNDDLFSARSHVLDLLNTTHVVSFANLRTFESALVYIDGVGLAGTDIGVVAAPGATVNLSGSSRPANQLIIVTSLANSIDIKQGETVAHIRVKKSDHTIKELDIRAGIDTSEWAHDRRDVEAVIKHDNARVYDSRPGDATNSFSAHRYLARFNLGELQPIAGLEVQNVSSAASLAVWRATLYDSTTGLSSIVQTDSQSDYWQRVYAKDQVEVLQNSRALPRAWLVADAKAVEGETALREIRGEGSPEFDPRRTALLEVSQSELPALPGGELAAGSTIKLTNYEPSRIRYETNSATATILVASEIFYPGWTAEVDGQRVRILLTDFLLRGVYLPPGAHTVEMRYVATGARNGGIISLLSLGIISALFVLGRRSARTA